MTPCIPCNDVCIMILLYVEVMKNLFKVKFSEKGNNVRAKEELVFFVDFMDECEGT